MYGWEVDYSAFNGELCQTDKTTSNDIGITSMIHRQIILANHILYTL